MTTKLEPKCSEKITTHFAMLFIFIADCLLKPHDQTLAES